MRVAPQTNKTPSGETCSSVQPWIVPPSGTVALLPSARRTMAERPLGDSNTPTRVAESAGGAAGCAGLSAWTGSGGGGGSGRRVGTKGGGRAAGAEGGRRVVPASPLGRVAAALPAPVVGSAERADAARWPRRPRRAAASDCLRRDERWESRRRSLRPMVHLHRQQAAR